MKKILLCFFLLLRVIGGNAQPHIYFNFVSHNEETGQWNGSPFYAANRAKLILLTNYFQSQGITWNMQSDWVYLTNVLTKETPALMALTNNKNILRWMSEDKGVEMDPHAHESQYIYPDVVKLMDSIGLPESKIIGGTIYNDSNGVNIWTNLVNGQNGIMFPSKFWKPDYMMGGGTPNHVADLKYYGMWNPQSPMAYLTNDTSVHLTHIGVGCSMKIRDTTTVAPFVASLRQYVENIQTGHYPPNGFYMQTIFFEQADLNTVAFYNKVIEIADSVNAIMNSTNASWKTFKQATTIWETTYGRQAFQWDCWQMATAVADVNDKTNALTIYPDPASSVITIKNYSKEYPLEIIDMTGKQIMRISSIPSDSILDVSSLANGIYLLKNGKFFVRFVKE